MTRAGPWPRVLRIPNIVTIPGDPLAGFFLAGAAGHAVPECIAAIAMVCALYLSGLVMNDLVDVEEDRRERPDRPYAAGELSRRAMLAATALLIATGFACAAIGGPRLLPVAGVLLLLILAYNLGGKRIPGIDALLLGLCRATALAAGATAVLERPWTRGLVLVGAAVLGLYVVAVSWVARDETRPERARTVAWMPVAVWLAAACALFACPTVSAWLIAAWLIALLLLLEGLKEAASSRVPRAIGRWIHALPAVQSCLILLAGASPPALGTASVVLLLHVPARWLGKRIAAS